MKIKHIAMAAGLVWTCTPFQDLPTLNTFRNSLPSYQAATSQVLAMPPQQIQCDTCDIVSFQWMLEYQDSPANAQLNQCGSAPAFGGTQNLRRALR